MSRVYDDATNQSQALIHIRWREHLLYSFTKIQEPRN